MPPYNPDVENWLEIPTFPDYDTSTFGRLRSFKRCGRGDGVEPKILNPSPYHHGYLYAGLMDPKGRLQRIHVARLVLMTFVGPRPDGMDARHFPDKDKTNNRLDNLQWATKSDNQRDQAFHRSYGKGREAWCANLTEAQVVKVLEAVLQGKTLSYVAKEFGIEAQAVEDIKNGKYWKHIGRDSRSSAITSY